MTIDHSKHKSILLQILKDIYSEPTLAPYLGFKGGTAALVFYNLDRDSVDLDFDLLDESKEDEIFKKIRNILEKYGEIKEAEKKRFNLFFLLSYSDKMKNGQNVKVEINRRNFGSKYELKTALGISMLVMVEEDMFANKLMAMFERMGEANRDIYDVWFFSQHIWPINKKLIEERAKMPFKEFLIKCIRSLEEMDNRHILNGLGEVLSSSRKDWAKAKLKTETLFSLRLALSNEK